MEKTDKEEDKLYGKRRGDELPEELATAEKRLQVIKKAKAELEAEARHESRSNCKKSRSQLEQEETLPETEEKTRSG